MHTKIAARFLEGLETGKFKPWTTPEISVLVEEMLGFSPLQELTAIDREVISTVMHRQNSRYLNRDIYHQLASDQVYFFPTGKEIPPGTDIINFCSDEALFFVPPLPNSGYYEGLKKKFDNITAILAKAGEATVGYHSSSLVGYGMRSLPEYGITPEHFLNIVKRIQNATGKNKINLLDVGGANGVALHDARQLTDAIITHNLTPTIEPAMFSTDFLYVCPAERMPASLRESMDFILSNYAFCYFPGQNLALENILQALSVGGEATIDVSFGKQEMFVNHFAARMAEQYMRMKQLHDQGYINLTVDSAYNPHPLDFPVLENNFYPPARVHLRKNKSLYE